VNKYLHIGINWVGPSKSDEIHDLIVSNVDDWFRYGGNCWIIWTKYDQTSWAKFLQPHMGKSYLVVYEVTNLASSNGILPTDRWEWFNRFRY
jgi:hypothetical protein